MSQRIFGSYAGTGSTDVTICCGFIPDRVLIRDIETTPDTVEVMKGQAFSGGQLITGSTGATSVLTATTGLVIYRGGVKLTADSEFIKVRDPKIDKRTAGALGTVTTWTLDSSANATGSINAGLGITAGIEQIGVGSMICIAGLAGIGKWYQIIALSNDGDAANDITLNEAAPTGAILAFDGPYTFIGAKAGIITPAGFKVTGTAGNTEHARILFEAELFDN